MYKHGILTRAEIPEGLSMSLSEQPLLAFTLLSEFEMPLSDHDEVAIEMICNAMATGHGLVHRRRTFSHRYDQINAAIIEMVAAQLPSIDTLRVYDVAVSNGVSAQEFFETLRERFEVDFFAMDYLDHIVVVGPIGHWRVVFDNVDRPLQVVGGKYVIPISMRVSWQYPVNRLLRAWVKHKIVPRAKRILAEAGHADARVTSHDAFHPRPRALAAADARFRLGFGDMYSPIGDRFDLVRAMSVFTNLDTEQINRAVRALCTSLEDGGLFVVGRNPGRDSAKVPTTIFQREARRLVPVRDLMGGAEQRDTVLSVNLT